MPSLKQLLCTIEWSDTKSPFQEYGTVYGDGVVESFIVVPKKPQGFCIRLKSQGYIHEGLAMVVFIDGNYQCNRSRLNLKPPKRGLSASRTEIDFLLRQKEKPHGEGVYMGREWRFDHHNIVAETPEGFQENHFDDLGTIEILVLRCQAIDIGDAKYEGSSSGEDEDVLEIRPDRKVDDEEAELTAAAPSGAEYKADDPTGETHETPAFSGLFDGASDYPSTHNRDGEHDARGPGRTAWHQYQIPPEFADHPHQDRGTPPHHYPQVSSRSRAAQVALPEDSPERHPSCVPTQRHVHFDYGVQRGPPPQLFPNTSRRERRPSSEEQPDTRSYCRWRRSSTERSPPHERRVPVGPPYDSQQMNYSYYAEQPPSSDSSRPQAHRHRHQDEAPPAHYGSGNVPPNARCHYNDPLQDHRGPYYYHPSQRSSLYEYPAHQGASMHPPYVGQYQQSTPRYQPNPREYTYDAPYPPQHHAHFKPHIMPPAQPHLPQYHSHTVPVNYAPFGYAYPPQYPVPMCSTGPLPPYHLDAAVSPKGTNFMSSVPCNNSATDTRNSGNAQNQNRYGSGSEHANKGSDGPNANDQSADGRPKVDSNDDNHENWDNNGSHNGHSHHDSPDDQQLNDHTVGDSCKNDGWSADGNTVNNDNTGDSWANNAGGAVDDDNADCDWTTPPTRGPGAAIVTSDKVVNTQRELFGPHGPYISFRPLRLHEPQPDAEEEPRYDVPKALATARQSTMQVQPGPGYRYYKKRLQPDYIDSLDNPYARFVFKYRTREQLSAELGINTDVEPTGDQDVQALQDLDKQELIEMLMRAKTALGGKVPSPPPASSAKVADGDPSKPFAVNAPSYPYLKYSLPASRPTNTSQGRLPSEGSLAAGVSKENPSPAPQSNTGCAVDSSRNNSWGNGGNNGAGGSRDGPSKKSVAKEVGSEMKQTQGAVDATKAKEGSWNSGSDAIPRPPTPPENEWTAATQTNLDAIQW